MEINTKRLHYTAIFCFATAIALLIIFIFSSYTIAAIMFFFMLWLSLIFRLEYWFNELYDKETK